MTEPLAQLIARHAGPGRLTWIGRRPARLAPMEALDAVWIAEDGLDGDRSRAGKRAATLIQAEHLEAVRALARAPGAGFADLRRNLAVAGINLIGLKTREVAVGEAVLRITGICAPCSRMEAALGPGGYSALRGHGGVTAEVLRPGRAALGDAVRPV
ncbi:MAG: MOSC domain-containing protein [Pseudomonadota bacterium]